MFSADGPLDMRMDRHRERTAAEVINTLSEKELGDLILQYGEERHARRIAAAIVRARAKKPFETTAELADVVRRTVGADHVVKSLARVFQSFRLFVNEELEALRDFLPQALRLLRIGGRAAVIDYHSLEARIVKEFMARESNPCVCPPDLPLCVCGRKPSLRVVHRQIKPDEEEIEANPSARSAHLRVFEKIGEAQ